MLMPLNNARAVEMHLWDISNELSGRHGRTIYDRVFDLPRIIQYTIWYSLEAEMKKKQLVRKKFRDAVFTRDQYTCVCCDFESSSDVDDLIQPLDAHHITPREEMPNGGYAAENGVSLCERCHILAEDYYVNGKTLDGYNPKDLYTLVGSSYKKALRASEKLSSAT